MKKELAPHWETAHPDLVSDIVRREADFTKGIEPLRTMKAQYEDLMGVFKPYEAMMAAENATPKAAMARIG